MIGKLLILMKLLIKLKSKRSLISSMMPRMKITLWRHLSKEKFRKALGKQQMIREQQVRVLLKKKLFQLIFLQGRMKLLNKRD